MSHKTFRLASKQAESGPEFAIAPARAKHKVLKVAVCHKVHDQVDVLQTENTDAIWGSLNTVLEESVFEASKRLLTCQQLSCRMPAERKKSSRSHERVTSASERMRQVSAQSRAAHG